MRFHAVILSKWALFMAILLMSKWIVNYEMTLCLVSLKRFSNNQLFFNAYFTLKLHKAEDVFLSIKIVYANKES
ncbi:hypothetical protein PROSTU_00840 [Providencia stuartii ATCC 25827]|uniref:Uncharacterized protein n=1 Tax=Providencia stuartii ATCC 25827 TaxID=471874 RepID=A0AA86YSW3_PROST|nr:hypothetical protein PROSTU_04306 [Providencia stuartii ATCC 25827]EDU57859.1 hypothetical protein PROSTU_04128 [Providencia stuartii ATCC 25827]EDU61157.1 hypothetical protein PROSTU_00840 [Providencia stuartii ATCC 25827]